MTYTSLRFLKFILAGGFGAVCYIVGSLIITAVGVEAWVASIFVYASLIPIVYLIQKNFVFESDRSHHASFPRYLIIQLIGLLASASFPLLAARLDISPVISFFCVVIFIALANYGLQLRWAFSKG